MKSTELVAYANNAMQEAWGYVWGADGRMYTTDLADKWAKAKWGGKDAVYFLTTCKRWLGHNVADCSGLIVAAMRSINPKYEDQASGTLFNRCTNTGKISAIPEIPGLLLWKPGHVGIYAGDGYALESRGVAYGVVRTKLAGRGWTHWGMLRDIGYPGVDQNDSGTSGISSMVIYRLLKRTSPMLVGDDVTWLQQRLQSDGYTLGSVDGIFGSKTETAVKSYQRAKGLVVDGKAGLKTIAALGGTYKG